MSWDATWLLRANALDGSMIRDAVQEVVGEIPGASAEVGAGGSVDGTIWIPKSFAHNFGFPIEPPDWETDPDPRGLPTTLAFTPSDAPGPDALIVDEQWAPTVELARIGCRL